MKANVILKPYIGMTLNNSVISFGDEPEKVTKLLGEPGKVIKEFDGSVSQIRGLSSITFDGSKILCEYAFSPPGEVFLNDMDLFSLEDPIKFLLQLDPEPYEYLGSLIFYNLGMTISGFHNDSDEDKTVLMFKRHTWDDIKLKSKKYTDH